MTSYNNELSTIYDIKQFNTQLQSITASSESVKYLFKRETLQGPKLAQLDKMLYRSFTAPHSKQKPTAGPTIIERAKYFEDEDMKITDKCTFSGCWL
jgi:cytochrome c556